MLADRYLFTALARDAARGLELDWLLHAYSPLLWPDLVIYFSMTPEDSQRRIASTRSPHFYEAGQDVTGIDDPLASYGRFIDRVVTEYENLAVIFKFVTVDAGDAVYRQHTQVRDAGRGGREAAVAGVQQGRSRRMAPKTKTRARLIAIDGSRGADVAKSAEPPGRSRCAPAASPASISRWDASGLFGELAQSANAHRRLAAHAVAGLRRRPGLPPALGDSHRPRRAAPW